jgi:hypothetical protein
MLLFCHPLELDPHRNQKFLGGHHLGARRMSLGLQHVSRWLLQSVVQKTYVRVGNLEKSESRHVHDFLSTRFGNGHDG